MITGTQIALHLLGDYVLQSDWMADNKTKRFWPAFFHAICYSCPFLVLQPSFAGFVFILGTHFLIDRYRLARFVCRWKNHLLAPLSQDDSQFNTPTGYADSKPDWLKVWLLIACDNTMHIFCNGIGLMI